MTEVGSKTTLFFQSTRILCKITRGVVLNAGNKNKDMEHIHFIQQEFFKGKDVSFDLREDESLLAI